MTDNHGSDTGQVSVAELLARNGQKVGARSGGRRRRGTAGGISVAELTGEIPVTRAASRSEAPEQAPEADDTTPQVPKVEPVAPTTPKVEPVIRETPRVEPVVPVVPKVEAPALVTPAPPTPSASEQTTVTPKAPVAAPVADAPKIESPTEVIRAAALPRRARAHLDTVVPVASSGPSLPVLRTPGKSEPRLLSGPASDLRGTGMEEDENEATDTLGVAKSEAPRAAASGKSGSASASKATAKSAAASSKAAGTGASAKKAAAAGEKSDEQGEGRRRRRKSREDEAGESGPDRKPAGTKAAGAKAASAGKPSSRDESGDDVADDESVGGNLKGWALLVVESIAAIVAGGLLFKGFEKLWDMLPWVAFGLALLVIVGLVALVRILRRTDDITSQLIALAVGVFVAFGPLLFLMPNG